MTDTTKEPADTQEKNANESDDKTQEQDKTQAIPKHRFDEVNEKYKKAQDRLAEIEAELKKKEEEDLAEKEKWQELAEKRAEEVEKARTELNTTKIRSAVERAASQMGAVDPSDIYRLIDSDSLKVNDEGEVEGADEAVKAVLEAKPYLKNGKTADNIGTGSNPDKKERKSYPLSWVKERYQDGAWCKAKHDDFDGLTGMEFLDKIEKDGLIDYSS
jgi:hypothetical protein